MPEKAMVWDPFIAEMPFERTRVLRPDAGVKLPAWLQTAFGLLAIAATIAIVVAYFWLPAAWFAVPALAISIGGLIGGDMLAKTAGRRDWLFFRIAERNEWAFRLIERDVRSMRGARKVTLVDPVAERVYRRIPELCRPRAGQLVPLRLHAMYWGTLRDSIPFWLGLQQYEVDATLAQEAIKKDAFGGSGLQGRLFNICVAYNLERDTGIRAQLLAEPLDRDGWLDFKTESVEFNRRFHITVTGDGGGDAHLALLRALTPATQSILIDLHDRYQAQLVIDGATIFFAGQDRIVSDEDDIVAARFTALVDQFVTAAVSFKPFTE